MRLWLRKSMMCVCLCGMMGVTSLQASAQVREENLAYDGSSFTDKEVEECSGTVYSITRGDYLNRGTGTVSRLGPGKLGAEGGTYAHMSLPSIKVVVAVEKYVNGQWSRIDSWSKTSYNTYYVVSYKTLNVAGGYYYRVKAQHFGGGEAMMYATDGLWMAT